MDLYVIRRRNGWTSVADLQAAAERSKRIADEEMPHDVRWIRSYVVEEDDGSLGTICVYQATSPEAIRAHAAKVRMPATEILRVADTVIVRPDPVPAAANG